MAIRVFVFKEIYTFSLLLDITSNEVCQFALLFYLEFVNSQRKFRKAIFSLCSHAVCHQSDIAKITVLISFQKSVFLNINGDQTDKPACNSSELITYKVVLEYVFINFESFYTIINRLINYNRLIKYNILIKYNRLINTITKTLTLWIR